MVHIFQKPVFCLFLCLPLFGCDDLFQPKTDGLDPGFGGGDGGATEAPPIVDGGVTEGSPIVDGGVTEGSPVVDSGMPGAADAGVESIFRLGNAASETFFQGTWRSPIKTTSSDPAGHLDCEQGEGWDANDGEDMVAHFQATNQNIYFQHMHWTTVNEEACERKNINGLALAAEEASAPLAIYTSFGSKKTKDEYVLAATSVRSLQADNSENGRVKGMSVDDFHVQLYKVTDSSVPSDHLTKEDVAEIYNALHFGVGDDFEDEDSGLEFIPYVASHVIADYIIPSAILGVRGSGGGSVSSGGDYKLHPAGSGLGADRVEFSIGFDIPSSVPLAGINLNFMHYDAFNVDRDHRDLFLIAELNGAQVFKKSVLENGDEDMPDMFAEEIELASTVPLYTSAPNVLRMWLEAEVEPDALPVAYGAFQNKLTYVWDVHLKAHGSPPIRLRVEDMVFDTVRDPARPGITNNDQMLAITNDAWRMDEFVDGVMVKLKATGGMYDSYTHKRFLQSTCGYLKAKGKRCLEGYWGNEQWDKTTFRFDHITDRFENAQRHTEGLVVWRLANDLGYPEDGVFAAKEPFDTSNYDVMAAFPRYTSAMPGWYQNWTVTIEEDGEYTLSWWDSGGTSDDTTPVGRMMKEAYIDGEKVWEEDVGETTGTDIEAEYETGTEGFTLTVGQQLKVGLAITDSFGTTDYQAQFRLTGPSEVIDLGDGDFASGTDDWGTQAMYDCTMAYYTSHDYRDVCLSELVDPATESSDAGP